MKAYITKKHPFWKLKPVRREKLWTVKEQHPSGAVILVDSVGNNLFADKGWWMKRI